MVELGWVAVFAFDADAGAVGSAEFDGGVDEGLEDAFGFLDQSVGDTLETFALGGGTVRTQSAQAVGGLEILDEKAGAGRTCGRFAHLFECSQGRLCQKS